jgi:hypothetical protein
LAVFIPAHPGLVPGLHPGAGMAEMAP